MGREWTGERAAVFLVVERDVLVGQDLAQAITEDHPSAKVIVVPSLEDAVVAVADVDSIQIAFVGAEPQALSASPLAQGLAMRGGLVVLTGLWPERVHTPAGWKMLPFPFTTDDVRGVMAAR